MRVDRTLVAGAATVVLAVAVLAGACAGDADRPVRGDPTPSATPRSSTVAWQPDLVEEFDHLDQRVWTVSDQTDHANEASYLLARNVTIENGRLRIQARSERAGGRRYTSGYVDTNDTYALPDHFRVQVRAKVPMEQGMWAAPLWLRPADSSGGEIDLVETIGSERARPMVHHTLHTDYGPGHRISTRSAPFSLVDDPSGTSWHTYTVEKTRGSIVMWVDGVETARWSSGDPEWFDRYYEAGKHWNLRVNLQVGGAWGGPPDATTDWTPDKTAMLVDYVRTWVPD